MTRTAVIANKRFHPSDALGRGLHRGAFTSTLLVTALLAACGGGGGGTSESAAATDAGAEAAVIASPNAATAQPATSQRDAVRLADQASFGASETLVAAIKTQGPAAWIKAQLSQSGSKYTSGKGGEVHQYTGKGKFCDGKGDTCWRDWSSTEPLVWDFYRNAMTQPDQLRQRMSFALQQIVVVNNLEVSGTYGFRNYYNDLMGNAFGNYRQVLKKVAMSPVMGDFLNNANNDKAAPNENFARELLQLFSIGTCELNADASLKGGSCIATYSNDMVRNYAYALTGWTYPAGGATPSGCWPKGTNCRYYGGDMIALASFHDSAARTLLSGVTLNGGHTAPAALDTVLDSLMAHPNMAPFIGKQLIQHLVSSNPSPAYVARVASAFSSGKYQAFGTGQKGDLAATVAAILLDEEARGDAVARSGGRLRDPVQMFTGVLRSLNGKTDGDALSWWWGEALTMHVFRPPSVFNYYPPTTPVPGTTLVGPAFAIHGANAALQRFNYLTFLLDWDGAKPNTAIPNAIGTKVDLSAFKADAADATKLVDRMALLALGTPLPDAPRAEVIKAVSYWTSKTDSANWQINRVKAAAYLVFASPNYQVQR